MKKLWPTRPTRRRDHFGMALGAVLMVVTLAIVVAFSLASTSVFHIRTVAREAGAEHAVDVAESTIAAVLSQFSNGTPQSTPDPRQWGQTSNPTLYLVQTTPASPYTVQMSAPSGKPYAVGIVTFSKSVAAAHAMQPSVNLWYPNGGTAPAPPAPGHWDNPFTGGTTPYYPDTVFIDAKATCSGEVRHAYAVVKYPQFPYAVASSGAVTAHGSFLVAAASKGSSPSSVVSAAPTGKGNLASNSSIMQAGTSLTNAVALNNQSHVTGDVQAVGNVSVRGATIDGTTTQGSSPVGLPQVDFNQLDPTNPTYHSDLNGIVNTINGATTVSNPTVSGFNKINGDYTVNGDLKFDDTSGGGVLYVEGNINITGSIQGTGVIVAHNGSVTVGQGSDMSSAQQDAVVATGDVTLGVGTGSQNSQSFQGLVYTEGNFNASNMTLMGAFVGAAPNPSGTGGTQMSVTNTAIYQVPGYTSQKISYSPPAPTTSTTWSTNPSLASGGSPFWIGNAMYPVHVHMYVDPANGVKYYEANCGLTYATSDVAAFWYAMGQFLANTSQSGLGGSQAALIKNNPSNWQNIYYLPSGGVYPGQYISSGFLSNEGWPPPGGTSGTTTTGGGGGTTGSTSSSGSYNYGFDLSQFIDIMDQTRVVFWAVN